MNVRSFLMAAAIATPTLAFVHASPAATHFRERGVEIACEPAPSAPPATREPLKVLFIGNSLTFRNCLPNVLALLAMSAGSPRQIHTGQVTVGAATLRQLLDSGTATAKIQEEKWDYVILQEASGLRSSAQMAGAARAFDAEIKKVGAKTLLFDTWAWFGKPEDQPAIDHAFVSLAKELNAAVAPVGTAWQLALQSAPDLSLYVDYHHPNVTGTYLAACVFYLVLDGHQQQCPTIENGHIPAKDMDVARRAAMQAVAASP